MKIKLIGQYPPPLGGISIHVQRLFNLLVKDGYEVTLYDDSRLPITPLYIKFINLLRGRFTFSQKATLAKKYGFQNTKVVTSFRKLFINLCLSDREKQNLIHYHTKNWKYRAALCLTSKLNSNNKIILTIHSMRDEYENFSFVKKQYIKYTLKSAAHFIVTNSHIKSTLKKWGANTNKITVIPPFFAPEEKLSDFEQIPSAVWGFISDHQPVLCANASKLRFYNNQDLYGLDMCVSLCEKLKENFNNVGFVFSLPAFGEKDYYYKIKNLILQKRLDENFLFITEQYSFYPILKNTDIFLRPTNTDGDALSIREALELNTPVVASDIVERPLGTILFKNRDNKDLYIRVLNTLQNLNSIKYKLRHRPKDENFKKTINIYHKITSMKS